MDLVAKPPVEVILGLLLTLFLLPVFPLTPLGRSLLAILGAPGGIRVRGPCLLPPTVGMDIGAIPGHRFPKARGQDRKTPDQIIEAFIKQAFVLNQPGEEATESRRTGYPSRAVDATSYPEIRVALQVTDELGDGGYTIDHPSNKGRPEHTGRIPLGASRAIPIERSQELLGVEGHKDQM